MSYLSDIYQESWFFWLWGGVQKTLKKRRKQTEEKDWKVKRKKNEEYEESQITKVNTFGFTFYIKNYILLENIVWKKVVYTLKFCLQFLYVAGYLIRNNDTPKLNIRE